VTGLMDLTQAPAVAFDVAITDLDGVCFRDTEPVEYATESIAAARAAGLRFLFLTNNAMRLPQAAAQRLQGVGIPAAAADVLTAAQTGAALVAQDFPPGTKVLVVGSAGLAQAVQEVGLTPVASADDAPAAVLQGLSAELTWRQLAEGAYAIGHGAAFYATNLDLTLPQPRGFAPGNGSMVAATVTATGVTPKASGKPRPGMFHLAAQRAGAANPLVIGDRLDTDLEGANNAGYPGLMVLTGVNTAVDACLAPPAQRPQLLAWDLRALGRPHPAPILEAATWWCGPARAWVEAGRLHLEGDPHSDEALRAAAAACWSVADAGQAPSRDSIAEVFGGQT
jgi:HAD superfamily hydrolase (TIGR01450 family)